MNNCIHNLGDKPGTPAPTQSMSAGAPPHLQFLQAPPHLQFLQAPPHLQLLQAPPLVSLPMPHCYSIALRLQLICLPRLQLLRTPPLVPLRLMLICYSVSLRLRLIYPPQFQLLQVPPPLNLLQAPPLVSLQPMPPCYSVSLCLQLFYPPQFQLLQAPPLVSLQPMLPTFGTSSDDEDGEPSASMGASSSAPNDQSNVDRDTVQQHGLTTVLRDGSGEEVTSMRVTLAFGSFFYMPLSIFAILYHCKFGCRLVPKGIRRRAAYEALGTLEGFKLHTITVKNANPDQTVKNANPDQTVKLTVLMRDGPELETMRVNLQERLGLTKKPILPIPEPLMCYSVMMLGCVPLEQLSGAVFQEMLPIITGVDFESLPVATSKGIRRMPYGELCRVAKKWARDLCRYTTNVRNRNKMLGMATRCYIAYTKECHAKENTPADLDLEGKIAKEMLKDGVFSSRLLLGIRKPEFKLLLKHLTFMIKNDKDEGIRTYMRNLSKHLFKQS
ncbi:hypothetical protein GGI03_003653 [Coemansia sp. RSA 2337]|nr:hypothetical protein GGI03_003653 [Coemansia sp. RSA 2337]